MEKRSIKTLKQDPNLLKWAYIRLVEGKTADEAYMIMDLPIWTCRQLEFMIRNAREIPTHTIKALYNAD